MTRIVVKDIRELESSSVIICEHLWSFKLSILLQSYQLLYALFIIQHQSWRRKEDSTSSSLHHPVWQSESEDSGLEESVRTIFIIRQVSWERVWGLCSKSEWGLAQEELRPKGKSKSVDLPPWKDLWSPVLFCGRSSVIFRQQKRFRTRSFCLPILRYLTIIFSLLFLSSVIIFLLLSSATLSPLILAGYPWDQDW